MPPIIPYQPVVPSPISPHVEARELRLKNPAITAMQEAAGALELLGTIQKKYQDHKDDLQVMEINSVLDTNRIALESLYETTQPEEWESAFNKKMEEAANTVSKMASELSPEKRDFVMAGFRSYHNLQLAKMQALRTKTIAKKNQASLLAAYETSVRNGNTEQAELIQGEYLSKWADWHSSPEEAGLLLQDIRRRGTVLYEQERFTRYAEEFTSAIQDGAFLLPDGSLDESLLRKAVFQTDLTASGKESLWTHMRQISGRLVQEWEKKKEQQLEFLLQESYPFIVKAMGETYNTKDAIPLIDNITSAMVEGGLVSRGQAEDIRRKLINWADDYASERKAEKAEEEKQTYMDFVQQNAHRLVGGLLTKDDVMNSRLRESQKSEWYEIIDKSREEPPAKSDFKSVREVQEMIFNVSMGTMGKTEAVNLLIQKRFADGSLTNEDYLFYLQRVLQPMPSHLSESLRKIFQDVEDWYDERGIGIFGIDWIDKSEKADYVIRTRSLMNWLDDYYKINNGRYPSEPEIYGKFNEMNVRVSLPKEWRNLAQKPAPSPDDPLYVDSDEKYDALESGTFFFNAFTQQWSKKP